MYLVEEGHDGVDLCGDVPEGLEEAKLEDTRGAGPENIEDAWA